MRREKQELNAKIKAVKEGNIKKVHKIVNGKKRTKAEVQKYSK